VFDAPERPPPLPAAVEVAAYRIAQEAFTNVVRHADARQCVVRLAIAAGRLDLAVSDDGRGLPEQRRAGVGLYSMRERAAELGGTCAIEVGSVVGTRVSVCLPYTATDPPE
jgi:signal transduction histidine kinase